MDQHDHSSNTTSDSDTASLSSPFALQPEPDDQVLVAIWFQENPRTSEAFEQFVGPTKPRHLVIQYWQRHLDEFESIREFCGDTILSIEWFDGAIVLIQEIIDSTPNPHISTGPTADQVIDFYLRKLVIEFLLKTPNFGARLWKYWFARMKGEQAEVPDFIDSDEYKALATADRGPLGRSTNRTPWVGTLRVVAETLKGDPQAHLLPPGTVFPEEEPSVAERSSGRQPADNPSTQQDPTIAQAVGGTFTSTGQVEYEHEHLPINTPIDFFRENPAVLNELQDFVRSSNTDSAILIYFSIHRGVWRRLNSFCGLQLSDDVDFQDQYQSSIFAADLEWLARRKGKIRSRTAISKAPKPAKHSELMSSSEAAPMDQAGLAVSEQALAEPRQTAVEASKPLSDTDRQRMNEPPFRPESGWGRAVPDNLIQGGPDPRNPARRYWDPSRTIPTPDSKSNIAHPPDTIPVYSYLNLTAANLHDEAWLPPPHVLLDDSVIYLVERLTAQNKWRGSRWRYVFDTNGFIRTDRARFGPAPRVLVLLPDGQSINYHLVYAQHLMLRGGENRLSAKVADETRDTALARATKSVKEKWGVWTWGNDGHQVPAGAGGEGMQLTLLRSSSGRDRQKYHFDMIRLPGSSNKRYEFERKEADDRSWDWCSNQILSTRLDTAFTARTGQSLSPAARAMSAPAPAPAPAPSHQTRTPHKSTASQAGMMSGAIDSSDLSTPAHPTPPSPPAVKKMKRKAAGGESSTSKRSKQRETATIGPSPTPSGTGSISASPSTAQNPGSSQSLAALAMAASNMMPLQPASMMEQHPSRSHSVQPSTASSGVIYMFPKESHNRLFQLVENSFRPSVEEQEEYNKRLDKLSNLRDEMTNDVAALISQRKRLLDETELMSNSIQKQLAQIYELDQELQTAKHAQPIDKSITAAQQALNLISSDLPDRVLKTMSNRIGKFDNKYRALRRDRARSPGVTERWQEVMVSAGAGVHNDRIQHGEEEQTSAAERDAGSETGEDSEGPPEDW